MDAIHGFRIDADSWMITMDAIRLNVLTHVSKKKKPLIEGALYRWTFPYGWILLYQWCSGSFERNH